MRRSAARPLELCLLGAAAALVLACEDPAPAPGAPATCEEPGPAWAPGRRLTQIEYRNTVLDLLGVAASPAWPGDAVSLGFDNQVEAQPFSYQHAEGLMSTAEEVAAAVDVAAVVPCDPAMTGEVACGSAFISAFGRRAYRRPLGEEERARLEAVFAAGVAEAGFDVGVRRVIEVVLQSTAFHHRFEVGVPDPTVAGVSRLTGLEVAARLSFFLWASAPDDALLDAAEAGALGAEAGVRAEAERMLADPRARRGLANFYRQWLRLDRLLTTTKSGEPFDQELIDELAKGTLELAAYVTFDSPVGTLRELYTTEIAVVTGRTAPLFGVAAPDPESFALVATPAGQRSGILTDPSILSAFAKPDQSSPVARGLFVREALLCEPLPSPPEGAIVETPPLDPSLTTRERFAQHTVDPSCAGCHALIDPVGFPLEAYDAVGRYRTHENGRPIDTSGSVKDAEDASGDVANVAELAAQIAESDVGRRCFATQITRYARGHAETPGEACDLAAMVESLGPDPTLREILLTVVSRPSFLERPTIQTGACP